VGFQDFLGNPATVTHLRESIRRINFKIQEAKGDFSSASLVLRFF
jgi:hypothetical protein